MAIEAQLRTRSVVASSPPLSRGNLTAQAVMVETLAEETLAE
jgi:hypothetical protein